MLSSASQSLEIPSPSTLCDFEILKGSGIRCRVCGMTFPEWSGKPPKAACRGTAPEEQAKQGGPGSHLKAMLKWIGITATPGCSCNKRAKHMDDMGAEWCRQNIETILGWLKEESDRRNLPFIKEAARGLVSLAISRSEKAAKRMARRTTGPT